MLIITDSAAKQISEVPREPGTENMRLRIAAKKNQDGNFEYAMGLDDAGENDIEFESNGIAVVVSEISQSLIRGATLDYVELNPGKFEFIFTNPNDPAHQNSK